MQEATKEKLSNYLARFFPDYTPRDDEDLFKAGFVTSLFAMQLVSFIEHEFQLTVETEDLDIANFCSIDALTQFVSKKLAAPAA